MIGPSPTQGHSTHIYTKDFISFKTSNTVGLGNIEKNFPTTFGN